MVYYRKAADSAYWDEVWDTMLSDEFYNRARSGWAGDLTDVYQRHLPTTGRILEAGCGRGQVVLALRTHGFDVEGIDYAESTVQRVKKIVSELPIAYGDVTNLDVPDGTYAGYISLGVVEHRHEGPEPFLREALESSNLVVWLSSPSRTSIHYVA